MSAASTGGDGRPPPPHGCMCLPRPAAHATPGATRRPAGSSISVAWTRVRVTRRSSGCGARMPKPGGMLVVPIEPLRKEPRSAQTGVLEQAVRDRAVRQRGCEPADGRPQASCDSDDLSCRRQRPKFEAWVCSTKSARSRTAGHAAASDRAKPALCAARQASATTSPSRSAWRMRSARAPEELTKPQRRP